ncbi:MAG: hypothetical protein IMF10_06170 [Proteobacteria bacterium]|nr:hypothetical protein [Pseudomonadota bacterium]
MGEIKSTLDIIMERTKGLALTEEEKEEIRHKELAGKIKGWVQKYLDDLVNLETLKSELKKEPGLQEVLQKELQGRLEPDDDNAKIFQLIKELLGIKKDIFVKLINKFQEEAARERSKRLEYMKKQLTKRRIFGSAVIPNLGHDTEWNAYYQKIKDDFKKEVRNL